MQPTKLIRRSAAPILVGGDFQIPFQDNAAVGVFLSMIRKLKPVEVHLLGDVVDFYALSDHLRDPDRRFGLQDELDTTVEFLRVVRKAAPKAAIYFYEGNHETRLRRYLSREAGELADLRSLSLPALLCFSELDIRFVPELKPHVIHRQLLLTHGTLCRQQSAYTARAMVDRYGMSVLHGHTHRLGTHYKTTWRKTLAGYENGCLCRLDVNPANAYTKGMPNWQHGFSIIHTWKRRGRHQFDVEQVRIIDGHTRFA
jgi:predicted phosphodiesterase